MTVWFNRFSARVAVLTGHYLAFTAALLVVLLWAVSGPFFAFSDTWQLVINTGTTVVTFLMVVLIQHTQTHDTMAIQIKLDELIKATDAADNDLIRAEDETDGELATLKVQYEALCVQHASLSARLNGQAG